MVRSRYVVPALLCLLGAFGCTGEAQLSANLNTPPPAPEPPKPPADADGDGVPDDGTDKCVG